MKRMSVRYWLVKADGLAAGKGVYCCRTTAEVLDAVRELVCARIFGDAGLRVMIEQVSDPPTPETRVENETHQRISAFEKITQLDADLAAARKELSVWSHESIRQVGEARAAQEAAEQRLHEIAAENLRADLADARGALLAAEATVGGLREALVFYAEPASWEDNGHESGGPQGWEPAPSDAEADAGSIARQALATPAPTGEVVRELVKAANEGVGALARFGHHSAGCASNAAGTWMHHDAPECGCGLREKHAALTAILAHPTLVGLGEKA